MLLQNAVQNGRYAVRQLRHAPGFAFTVVLTLALSVGIATAVFCVFNTVLLRPLPYEHPEKIVDVESISSNSRLRMLDSWPSYQDERAQTHAFAALAGYSTQGKITMETPSNGAVALDCVRSSDNFFQIFGVKPILGRTYLPGEEKSGKNEIVLLSYEVWQNYFGGDRGVVNKAVKLNDHSYTVIGVMPAGFRYPLNMRNAVYTPRFVFEEQWLNIREVHWVKTVARLKNSVSIVQAQADLTRVSEVLSRTYPSDGDRLVALKPLPQSVTSRSKGPLWALLGAVLAVLAIGSVNVAGLLLARGIKREREMAMLAAMGASRLRVMLQLLTEGLLLALLGAAGGVLLASLLLNLMRDFLNHALPRGVDIHMDWTALTVAIAIAVITSLSASLYPALRLSSVDPNRALKAGGCANFGRSQHRLRSGFVVSQMALTLVLLVVAGLLLRTVSRYRHIDLGFDPAHILSVQIGLSKANYQGRDPLVEFYKPLEEQVSRLPGVQASGLISNLPIADNGANAVTNIAGQAPKPPNQEEFAEVRTASSGYYDVMGLALHRGRKLSPTMDRAGNLAPTVVVNDAFVSNFIPASLDPTTQRIMNNPRQERWTQIVGVAGNVRQNLYEKPLAEYDFLMDEVDPRRRAEQFANMFLLVRTGGDPAQIIPAVHSIVHQLDPTVAFQEPKAMTEVVSDILVFERMESWLFGIFAGLALALSLVGLYGLISHEVEMNTRDIGVRMALGASRNGILRRVLTRVAWMLGAGTVAGLILTFIVRKLIGEVIYIDTKQDAVCFLLVATLLVIAGMIAALIPARRAASIEPMQALRTE